jgi:trimeric autotransporter adhesin
VTLGSLICRRAWSSVAFVFILLFFSASRISAQTPATPPAPPVQQQPPTQASPQIQTPPQTPAPSSDTEPDVGNVSAEGVVHTADGSPVPGAALRLVNTDTQKAWVTWTDEAGKFEFPAVPPGHYTATATQLGFVQATADAQLSADSSKPMQLVLRVATLAELSAQPGTNPVAGRRPGGGAGQSNAQNGQGAPGAAGNRAAGNGNAPSGGRNGGGRGALPPGLLNAMQQGMASGGFQQTDVTGEGANGQEEASVPGGAGLQPNLNIPAGGGSSSDAFLLQGTTGQGLAFSGPNGGQFGNFGQNGFQQSPGGANIPGVAGNQGGPGGPGGGALPGGAPFAGGRGMFGGRGGGGPGGGGRLFRQNVNRVRFSFYDRYSNSAFDARPFPVNGVTVPKIGTYDERVGANMGGPLKIPHIYDGSDHTYFFVNYQHETLQNAINTYSIVPNAAERAGCFLPTTNSTPIFEPFTTTPYPFDTNPTGCAGGQQIPVSTTAQGLLAFIPQANQTATALGQNYLLQGTTPQNTDILNTNVLHTINAKWNANAGYNFYSQRENTLGNFIDIAGTESIRNQSVTLGLSHNWSPHVVESEQLVWTRSRTTILSDNSFGTDDITANLGIEGASTTPIDFGIPEINFTGFSGLADPIPSLVRNQTLRASDSLSWTRNSHTMRFGGEVRRLQYNTDTNPIPRGDFIFTGLATGNEFADFLLGYPQTASVQFGNPNSYLRSWGVSAYAQDDWRVTKTFSLQYGVRYDAVTPPVEVNNNLVNLDVSNLASVFQVGRVDSLPNEALPRALVHGKYDNFEPRIGIAWQPKLIKPKTVIRAGYSIFYNESIYATLAKELTYQPPVDTTATLVSSSSDPLMTDTALKAPETSGISILNTEAVNPFYKPGYAQIWNLGTETSFSQNWILDLTYTGTKGTDLDVLRAPNRAPLGTPQDAIQENRIDKNATGYTLDQSGANSIYNALQARVMHRFTHGFMLQGIYTWSKSLDDASSIGGGAPTVEQQDGNLHAEYGLSTFDVRDQFRAVSMWELPFGERHRMWNHGWKSRVFSDWRLQNIATWQTGTPFTALLGGVASDNGTGTNFSLRPNIIGNPNEGICGGSRTAFFNTGVFTLPVDSNGDLTYGDEPRGAIEGPCTFNWNLSLAKTIRFGPERRRTANFSWQVTNLTNTASFTGIGTELPCFGALGSGTTGNAAGITCDTSSTSTSGPRSFFGRVTSAGAPRSMLLMVRINL